MSRSEDPMIAALAQVLQQSFSRKPDSAGAELIHNIEEHRRRLLNCHEPLVNGELEEPMPNNRNATVSRACRASKGPYRALPLYFLVRQFSPVTCLELGTNLGISAAYQAAALIANQNDGRLITLEGSIYGLKIARDLHRQLGFDNIIHVQGLFTDTLPSTLENAPPIDYAFIDGHHQYEPTLNYFEMIAKHCSENAILVFDDIRWSAGMRKAWFQIRTDRRLSVVLDLFTFGICLTAKPSNQQPPQVLGPFFKLL